VASRVRSDSITITDNMLVITRLESYQTVPTHVVVSWIIQSTSENLNDYRLYVYRCEAPSANLSDYTLLSADLNPNTTASFNDTTIYGITHKFIDMYYKVLVSGLIGQGTSVTAPHGQTVADDKYAAEIVRRRNIVFQKHSGQHFHFLKRKSFGTFCPVCYDPVLQRTTQSKCLTCYDTGYLGGYYPDLEINGQLSERPVREMHQMFGQWQDQDAVLYIDGTPLINPKDIISDRLNRRWVVLNVGSAGKAMHTIGQIAQLRQIEKEDIIYSVPI
jgi:hypothetical protein